MADEFGDAYAAVILRDHWITPLQSTARDALEHGVPARDVWQQLCEDLQVPVERRYGRGLRDPQE